MEMTADSSTLPQQPKQVSDMLYCHVFGKIFSEFRNTRNTNRLLTEQARLVSCLLYGTLFLIAKCTSGAINLFVFLSFTLFSFLWFFFFFFFFFCCFGFFSLFRLQILNLPASLQNKNTRAGPFPVRTAKS